MYYDDNRRNAWKMVSTKKVAIFFKGIMKKSGHSGKKLDSDKIFRIYSKMVRQKRGIRERNWVDAKKSKFFQK